MLKYFLFITMSNAKYLFLSLVLNAICVHLLHFYYVYSGFDGSFVQKCFLWIFYAFPIIDL